MWPAGTASRLRQRAHLAAHVAAHELRHRRHPHPGFPLTRRYVRNHQQFVVAALQDEQLVARFREGELPQGYGLGFDERVVEYPWLLAHAPYRRLLDAGSVLNHVHILSSFRARADELTITTLAPEPNAFTDLGVSYVYGDLRDLPFRDRWFDTVMCASTLEHVGKDNSGYGGMGGRADEPRREAGRALAELRRVVRPGGRLLLTVPYGEREDHGSFRQLDRADLDDLLAHGGAAAEITVFMYTAEGWRRGGLADASTARYNDPRARLDGIAAPDLAPAARAVACVELSC